ncbi:unnamed protein product [Bemisia tabaci]|uniref:Uncharacterized protein n=1 Tax=Bemisia tabaci TaxID=7038 RepID=A0A9P0A6H2_BEMTA|nr:unnamed protein product [Bemisia tabaci]
MAKFDSLSRSVFLNLLVCLCATTVHCNTRVKRYLTYPPNSAIVLTMSLLKIMPLGHGANSMTEFDLIHPLPDGTKQAVPSRNKHKRERRDLLQQLETILEEQEFGGRSCIQKAICEAGRLTVDANEDNLVKELFQLVFKPLENGPYVCRESLGQNCPFSPLNTVLAWTEHFRQQNLQITDNFQ